GRGAAADVADLALPDEVVEGAERLLDLGLGIGPVGLVEVDVVRAQPPQRVLAGPDHVRAGQAPLVRAGTRGIEDLGRHDHVVATTAGPEPGPDDPLRLALRVAVARVHEVDAARDRGVEDRAALLGRRGVGEVVGPEREGRDLEAGAAEPAVLHGYCALYPAST